MNPNTKRVPATIMSRPNKSPTTTTTQPFPQSPLPKTYIQYKTSHYTYNNTTTPRSHHLTISLASSLPSLSKNSNRVSKLPSLHSPAARHQLIYSKTPPHLPTTTQPHHVPTSPAVVEATCAAPPRNPQSRPRGGPTRGSWGTVTVGDGVGR